MLETSVRVLRLLSLLTARRWSRRAPRRRGRPDHRHRGDVAARTGRHRADIAPRLRHLVEALRSASSPAPHHGPRVDAGTLSAIAAATERRERGRLAYVDHHGVSTVRQMEPHRLVHTGRRWSLLAWDTHRED